MTEAIESTAAASDATPPLQEGTPVPAAGQATPPSTATADVPVQRTDAAGASAAPAAAGDEAQMAAWDLFEDDFANHISGLARDADAAEQTARELLSQGHGIDTAVALRALAAEARQRARDDGVIGSALRGLGIDATAAHLDAVADQMAWNGGFDLVEDVWSGDEGIDHEDPETTARIYATGQFDLLVKDHLTPALATDLPRPPDTLADEPFPLRLQERDLRSAGVLAITLRRQLDEVRRVDPGNLPALRGLALTLRVIEESRRGQPFPANHFARIAVGTDPTPLHTAVRLRQVAGILDKHLPDRRLQRQLLGPHDGLSLAGKLEAMASEINRIADHPVERAKALVAGTFVLVNQDAPNDRSRAEAVSDSPARAQAPAASDSPEATATQFDPDLPLEQALLGSLLNAPNAIEKIENLLGARDFANPEMRVVYEALRALHHSGGLYDVASLPTEAGRLRMAQENHLKLFQALQTSLVPHNLSRRDIQRLLGEINAAAPAESLPFRGVFEPAAQFDLARKVWESGFSRRMASMAVQMDRGTPLVSPSRLVPGRSAWSRATNLEANLEAIEGQLDAISAQLASAVRRTGVDAAGEQAASAVVEASRRWRMPDPLRAVLAPLRHRAERHILHLALHAGHMESIPQAILDLQPEHFGGERHANLWRTIKDLQSRGLPVNWVAVHQQTRAQDFAHQPMPSIKELAKMGAPPEVDHDKVRRSLGMLVSSALARAKADVQNALVALADTSKVPTEAGIAAAKSQVRALRTHATTASTQLEQIGMIGSGTRPPPPRPYPGDSLTRAGGPRA